MSEQELELPKGWVKSNVGTISELIKGVSYKKDQAKKNKSANLIPILRANNFNQTFLLDDLVYLPKNLIKPEQMIKKNDIILSMSSGSKHLVGKSIMATSDMNYAFGTFCGLIRPSKLIYGKLLGFFLHSAEYRNLVSSLSKGSNINNLRREHIESLQFSLPPLNEQKRIISKIEELFSKIDSTKQSLEHTKLQLELYKQSLFKSLFNKTKNFVSLEECSKIGTGGTPSRKKPEYYGGNTSWVKTTEVQNSYIRSTSEKITELGLKNSNAKIHPKNSVIVAMYGEGKTRGKCAILDIDASTNQACAVITCDSKKLLFKFCFYWFQSQYDQMRLKSSGGNQPNLNLGIIKKTQIPLPPLEEQEQIVSQIEQGFSLIENTTQIVNSTLQTLQTMKMSILKQAFEGKLIPQDPNDEPAEKLLERIKKEKSGNKRQ